ncbi:MAG: tripartite tricarboxylate transporter TctB family protein [Rubrivivax sp.]|nr:tripartite tricarboxylate transporter TctB family protein [Rubrivivax sp.]
MSQRTDRAVGAALAALGALVVWTARAFPAVPGQKVGAGFLPTLVGAGLAVCGVLLVLRRSRGAAQADVQPGAPAPVPPVRYAAAAIVLASLLGYLLFADRLGFLLVAPLMVLAGCLAFGTSWRAALLWSIGGTLVVHFVFYKLLRVPLPWGVLRPFY